MYSLSAYASMIADGERTRAYAAALQAAVKPGSVVVEIGTGIGAFAILAKKLGARRVVAIEPGDAIAVARLIAEANGEREIEFIQGLAKDVTLSEPADIVVSDLRGILPVYGTHIESIVDARQRLLAPTGVLIPAVDTLYVAAVEAPDRHAALAPSFSPNGTAVTLDALRAFTANTWGKARVKPEQLLTRPEAWARIEYRTVEESNVKGSATLSATRDGTAHGLLVWFDAMLFDGVSFSNAPDQPELIYGSAFFPWPEPVDVREGDAVAVTLKADRVQSEHVWRWDSVVRARALPDVSKASFRQSTFFAEPFVAAKLKKGAANHVPTLSEDGLIERFILDSMDGHLSNDQIAARLRAQFPSRFPRVAAALGRVGEMAQRLSDRKML